MICNNGNDDNRIIDTNAGFNDIHENENSNTIATTCNEKLQTTKQSLKLCK